MPRSRRLLAIVVAPSERGTAEHLTASPTAVLALLVLLALFALFALLAFVTSTAAAQGRATADTPLHVPASRFEFVASGGTQPPSRPVAVHNGGATRLTNVRLTRLAYADSARGAAWLVALPRQTVVAPDELATVGTLCVDATGLRAGTYQATAAVAAREVPDPVPITITLVVTGARARHATARCTAAVSK